MFATPLSHAVQCTVHLVTRADGASTMLPLTSSQRVIMDAIEAFIDSGAQILLVVNYECWAIQPESYACANVLRNDSDHFTPHIEIQHAREVRVMFRPGITTVLMEYAARHGAKPHTVSITTPNQRQVALILNQCPREGRLVPHVLCRANDAAWRSIRANTTILHDAVPLRALDAVLAAIAETAWCNKHVVVVNVPHWADRPLDDPCQVAPSLPAVHALLEGAYGASEVIAACSPMGNLLTGLRARIAQANPLHPAANHQAPYHCDFAELGDALRARAARRAAAPPLDDTSST